MQIVARVLAPYMLISSENTTYYETLVRYTYGSNSNDSLCM